MPPGADHWDDIYATRAAEDLSWFEREPATSLRLIESVASGAAAAVVDVGAGASLLADRLLTRGFGHVTVVDISRHALDAVRARLGDLAARATFVHDDVLTWEPDRAYDVWHDRAVFHFLTDAADRAHYAERAAQAVRGGGAVVLATFAEDGPTHCSGLPVMRAAPRDLAAVFSAHFALVADTREDHVTPAGVVQPFTWVVLRRA